MKLWGGRFTKNTNDIVDDFNSSIKFDKRLYKHDILGSIAHAKMLGDNNIIPNKDAELIIKTLNEILDDIEQGNVKFQIDAEDIHMNIEKLLIDRIGDIGKKLHTGRSRNDQVALDTRMYLKDEINEIIKKIADVEKVIIDISLKNLNTIMPGYTHLQKAQPITFAHHLMAYFEMFKRDIQRLKDCYKRVNIMPLGSGALAGTTYNLDRHAVANELSFDDITQNSIDGVSDRDYIIELISCLSILMMHLSRFCEEIIIWSTNEFSFIEIDDSYSTGSSIMPQKKNPDVAELIRGKSGRIYGDLIAILTVMKSLPLAYNKDMQEDKEAVFDAIDTVNMCLPVFKNMIKTMKIKKENMLKETKKGYTNATDLADYLVKKGVSFRNAHEVVGKMVLYCIQENKNIEELSLNKMKEFSDIIDKDVYNYIDIEKCIEDRNLDGGPAQSAVKKAINIGKNFLDTLC